MASYLQLIDYNTKLLDPSEFNLAKPGVHVFTTFTSYLPDGKLALLRPDLHIQRIINGSKILGINSPLLNEDYHKFLFQELRNLIIKNYKDNKNRQKIRIIQRDSKEIEIHISPYEESWQQAISLISYQATRKLAEIKHTDFEVCIAARKNALENNAQEALLIDHNNLALEGAWSNIFWFEKESELCTTKSKILPGVTRKIIMEIADVKTKEISLKDLINSKDVFVTQSTSGITPVVKINNNIISNSNNNLNKIERAFNNYLKNNLTLVSEL